MGKIKIKPLKLGDHTMAAHTHLQTRPITVHDCPSANNLLQKNRSRWSDESASDAYLQSFEIHYT